MRTNFQNRNNELRDNVAKEINDNKKTLRECKDMSEILTSEVTEPMGMKGKRGVIHSPSEARSSRLETTDERGKAEPIWACPGSRPNGGSASPVGEDRPLANTPWPGRRALCLQSSMQVVGEELKEGLVYTVSLRKVPVHRGPGQGRVKAEDLSPLGAHTAPRPDIAQGSGQLVGPGPTQLAPEEERGGPREGESCTVRTVKAGRWEALAEHLVPAWQEGDLGYVLTFLGTYHAFASTEQVLDQLFHRTLCSLLGTWMDQYWEDFLQPLDAPCLQLLATHAQEHLPGSGLQCCAALLLAQMRHPEPTEAEPEAPVSAPEPPMPPVRPPAPVPLPAADTGPEPESAPLPPELPASEVAPAPAMQIEPDSFRAVAPAPELQVAPAPPQLPPTEMGPVPSLELDHPTRSAGAPAQEPRAAAAPSGAGAAELEAHPAPPASPPLHGSALPALEGEPAPPAAEALAFELEDALGPPPLPPVEVAPVPSPKVELAPSAGAAPAAPSAPPVGEGEAVPPPPPVPPAQVAPVPTLELQPVQAPSGATALKGEPSCPWPGPCGDGLHEQKPELLAFPPELVTEQLLLMDAELFKKVVPYHCLGSIWSQRKQKGKEHVAPMVCAVISQVNRMADCVMATCLRDHSMKAADRARVVEHWIEVARECRTLHDLSSAHAILSALESHAIGCQKKTWEEVSRDSFHLFQTLSEIFSTESNSSGQRADLPGEEQGTMVNFEKRRKVSSCSAGVGLGLGAGQERASWQGTPGLQAASWKTAGELEEKRHRRPDPSLGREYQLVAELQQLQVRCCDDCLVPDGHFGTWFEAVEQLGQDSLLLSREWELPPESASESFQAQQPPEGSKALERRGPDTESSGSSSSSTAHSSVQLQGGPDLSGGDTADSAHMHVAGSSGSVVEIHLDHVPEAQDGQEVKGLLELLEQSGLPRGSWPSADLPSPTAGAVDLCIVSDRLHRHVSVGRNVLFLLHPSQGHPDSRLCYKWHMGDRCFIRVTLAEDSGHKAQSILVTDQDRAPAVIRKALEEHELAGEQPADYQLVQIISGDGTLQIPDGTNVYYAMVPSPDYRFLLLRKTTPLDAEIKKRPLSALWGSRQKGPRF
nr:ral guanine nucleotide dissociation stimulator-like [Dasypus novemcinctus]